MISYVFDNYRGAEFRQALTRADPVIFQDAIRFLEDDPRTFGSGYTKELIWKYIKRYALTPADITRLENIALKRLERPLGRDFKHLCQTMCRIATPSFWERVEALLNSDNPHMRLNTYCLNAYVDGIYAGEKRRMELRRYRYYWSNKQNRNYASVDQLIALINEAENWQEGVVVRKAANPADLPILYYYTGQDHEFSTLDMRFCIPDVVLPKLAEVLSNGMKNDHTDGGWTYTIYLLRQIDDVRAVAILKDFLKNKIDYKFDKGGHLMTTLKVLRSYATPEALEIVAQHRADDQEYTEYYAGSSHGWTTSYP